MVSGTIVDAQRAAEHRRRAGEARLPVRVGDDRDRLRRRRRRRFVRREEAAERRRAGRAPRNSCPTPAGRTSVPSAPRSPTLNGTMRNANRSGSERSRSLQVAVFEPGRCRDRSRCRRAARRAASRPAPATPGSGCRTIAWIHENTAVFTPMPTPSDTITTAASHRHPPTIDRQRVPQRRRGSCATPPANSRVSVCTLIFSPSLMNSGTRISMPGFERRDLGHAAAGRVAARARPRSTRPSARRAAGNTRPIGLSL